MQKEKISKDAGSTSSPLPGWAFQQLLSILSTFANWTLVTAFSALIVLLLMSGTRCR